jgi:metal-dependent HD superfamily phosphatase/phosphodiesterase
MLEQVIGRVNADDELRTWWHIANLNAVARMGMNDHSWVHMQIVTNIGLKLLRLLARAGVRPAMVSDYGLTQKDAEVVVLLGCLLHDVGMSIHRVGHEEFSLFLADRKARELLDGIYDDVVRTAVVSEALQSIITHRSDGRPLTIEAGVVRVADSLDMTHGRSRIPFEQGSLSIHALSAAAVDRVRLKSGRTRAIEVQIEMNNSSGVFQVDELLRKKLKGSGLEEHVEIQVTVHEHEKRLLDRFTL